MIEATCSMGKPPQSCKVFLKTKPSDTAIRDFLACQAQSRFSYPAVGASAAAFAPVGYVADHNRVLLGRGEQAWHHAVRLINTWQMFNMEWVRLCWPDAPIVEGVTVAVLLRHFGFWSLNAARIVYTLSEDIGPIKRYGFAYGTLLDHGESGEERFSVEWQSQDDSVWYDLFAFSRPRAVLAKIGYPLARRLQHRFVEGSKAAMARAVA
jgi:uncharacterized protein (UPF0548 family)